MYYVSRGRHGAVIGAWSNPQFRTQESVQPSDSRLIRYLNSSPLSQRLAAAGVTVDDIASAAVRVGMFVDRDADGAITAAWNEPKRDLHERVPFDDSRLQAFLAPSAADEAA